MTAQYDVVVVGELNVDLILKGGVMPVFGQVEKVVENADMTIGSSSAIFACGAARLGLKVAFIGKVGQDTFGEFMLRSLQGRGVDTRGIIVDPTITTGLSVILAEGADRAILTHLGGSIADLRLDEICCGRPGEVFADARHLHYASYYLQAALRPQVPALFQHARELGLSISLDTNYDPQEEWNGGLQAILPLVDLFLPNETEAKAISGQPDLSAALDWLAGRVPLVAVKLGGQGALARQGAQCWTVKPLPVQVVDTVGAGDSFDAGFVYGLLRGWPVDKSLALANACGALSTQAAGGTTAQATLDEAVKLVDHPNMDRSSSTASFAPNC